MTPLEQLQADLAALRARRTTLRAELEQAARAIASGALPDQVDGLRARIDVLRGQIDGLRNDQIGRLRELSDPRQLVSELENHQPILLLPLRLETRWEREANGWNLLVRVYPDDISVQSHDRALTPPELKAGKGFWEAHETSADPNVHTRGEIWRGMVEKFGPRRTAWIRAVTDPDAEEPPEETPERLTLPAAWTLPERLAFRFYGPHGLLIERLGLPIPDGLEMSFDLTRQDLGFKRVGNDFEFPPELRWQVDFEEAVNVGMAYRLPLGEFGVTSLKRLIVLGVRLSTDQHESVRLFERLIEDHRFSDGFSLIKQGTPTNITNEGEHPAIPDSVDFLKWLEGPGAFTAEESARTRYDEECDGLRLAHALGISPESVRYLDGTANQDGVEAIAMKRALWAGTLGYYIQQMLSPFFENGRANDPFHGERMIAAARFFFTNFVFGRGPLPPIRVGDQPYGILPVSATSLKPSIRTTRPWADESLGEFTDQLQDKMAIIAPVWVKLSEAVKRAGAGLNADDRLLSVLSQQASSVEFRSVRLIGRDYLSAYTAFKDRDKYDQGIAKFTTLLNERFNAFQDAFTGFFPSQPRIFDLSFFGGVWEETLEGLRSFNRHLGGALLHGDVIDNLPFSEIREIAAEYPNYIKLMAGGTFDQVRAGASRQKPDGSAEPVSALLYLLLRHSYLYEHALAAMRLHHHLRNVPWPEFREKELYNVLYTLDSTYWEYLEEPVDWFLPQMGPRRTSALDLIVNRRNLRDMGPVWATFFGDVEEHHDVLRRLADLHTAPLERLFAEHLDLASYRIDAWYTGLAYQRLLGSRTRGDAYTGDPEGRRDVVRYQFNAPLPYQPGGLHLGAYGWLENLNPDSPGMPAPDLPEELRPEGGRPVTLDPDNYGLVHAPSLNHAVTAALLRSASVTQPDRPAFNIDLSSARVRDALWMIDGVRNGQLPAALLGYRFERILAEIDVKLLAHLPKLRAAFPMPKPQETATDQPLESTAPADVVNGMLLVQSLRSDFAARTSFATEAQAKFAEAAKRVADLLDAAGDLMLAESVHHAAQGNFERAGSVVTAASEFTHVPPEFEVVETPRSGASLTHRLLFGINTAVFEAPPASPRARVEPELNSWLGSLLPDLSALRARVIYFFSGEYGEQRSEHIVRASELGLEPIDLIYATDAEDSPELSSRIDAAARPAFEAANPGAAPEKIRVRFFPMAEDGARALGELLPLLDSLRNLLTQARGATLRDMESPRKLHGRNEADLNGVDLAELIRRVFGVSDDDAGLRDPSSLWFSFVAARDALSEDVAATVEDWRKRLAAASLFGISEAVPQLPASHDEALESLQKQAVRVRGLMKERLDAVGRMWTAPHVPKANVIELAGEVTRIVLGGNFPLMPRIQPSADIPPDLGALATPQRIEDWLFGAAQVREPARRLQHARVLASEFARPLGPLQARQEPETLPFWVADELPANFRKGELARMGELASFTIQPAGEAFDIGRPFGALVIDEWNELLPQETETTGVAFHYDASNTEPPQSLLLAVSDRALPDSSWSWAELVGCVEQALSLVKVRVVTPDQLRETPLDVVLPATYSAESSTPATIAVSWMANISPLVARTLLEGFETGRP